MISHILDTNININPSIQLNKVVMHLYVYFMSVCRALATIEDTGVMSSSCDFNVLMRSLFSTVKNYNVGVLRLFLSAFKWVFRQNDDSSIYSFRVFSQKNESWPCL